MLSNHTGGRVGLYLFEPDPPRLELVREDDELDITGVEWNAAGTDVAGLTLEGQRPKYAVVDGKSLRVQALRRLAGAFRGQWARVVSQSRDGNRLVVNVFSDRNPGVWYLVELASDKVRTLMAARPGIPAPRMAGTESLSIEARDGLMLHGYLTQGDAADGQPKPLIVLPHAGPHGVRDGWAFDPGGAVLRQSRLRRAAGQLPGLGGLRLEFERARLPRVGAGIVHDIVDATRAAAERATVDADRICIVGTHYGAFAALAAVTQAPDLYDCVVGHAGIYDLGLIWGRGAVPRHLGDENSLRRWIGETRRSTGGSPPCTMQRASRCRFPVPRRHRQPCAPRPHQRHGRRLAECGCCGDDDDRTGKERSGVRGAWIPAWLAGQCRRLPPGRGQGPSLRGGFSPSFVNTRVTSGGAPPDERR